MVVFEFVNGGDLRNYLRKNMGNRNSYANQANALGSQDLISIMLGVAKGMYHLAENKVHIHYRLLFLKKICLIILCFCLITIIISTKMSYFFQNTSVFSCSYQFVYYQLFR